MHIVLTCCASQNTLPGLPRPQLRPRSVVLQSPQHLCRGRSHSTSNNSVKAQTCSLVMGIRFSVWNNVKFGRTIFLHPVSFHDMRFVGGGRGIMLRCSDRTPTTEQTQDKTNNYTKIHLKPLDKTKKCITGSLRISVWDAWLDRTIKKTNLKTQGHCAAVQQIGPCLLLSASGQAGQVFFFLQVDIFGSWSKLEYKSVLHLFQLTCNDYSKICFSVAIN